MQLSKKTKNKGTAQVQKTFDKMYKYCYKLFTSYV